MKLRVVRTIVIASAALTGPMSPFAAPRADALIVGDYYESTVSPGCAESPLCKVEFSAIPTGKAVVVDGVSCRGNTTKTPLTATIYAGSRSAPLEIQVSFDGAETKLFTVALTSRLRFAAGQKPTIWFEANGLSPWVVSCHLSGAASNG